MKNILFDFGGVFVDLDMDAVNMGIQSYLGTTFQALYQRNKSVFDGFETGHLSETEFVDAVTEMGLPKSKIKDIWNKMVLGIPKNRIEFLESLQGKYNLYLYSNTNVFHESELNRLMWAHHNMSLDAFRKLFDGSWFSHDIGWRKPGPEGFEYIIKATGIRPEETLFIDDSPTYLEGAKIMGMHTILHDVSNDIAHVFEEYVAKTWPLSPKITPS
ncbi:MAG TPA: HAD family phosphatase [Saprospiraceae bacterium]|nr:HAD family phosphatase [Saprospiraceae bacterium]